MSTKLDQFYSSAWTTGIARPNRFEVTIIPPVGRSARGDITPTELNSSSLSRHLSFVCEGVEIPSQTIATADVKINGMPTIPIPYSFSYSNQLNLVFKLSENYIERNAMLLWQNMVYSPGRGFKYYNDYVGTILVRPMNTANVAKQEFVFRNCFPITIQDLQLSWSSNNENLKQGVTFSFFSVEVREMGSDGLLSRPSGNGNAPVMISGHQGEVNPIRELIDIMNSENELTLLS